MCTSSIFLSLEFWAQSRFSIEHFVVHSRWTCSFARLLNLPSGKSKLASSSQKANFTITGFCTILKSEKEGRIRKSTSSFSISSMCIERNRKWKKGKRSGSGSFFIDFQLLITDHFSSYWENTIWIRQAHLEYKKFFSHFLFHFFHFFLCVFILFTKNDFPLFKSKFHFFPRKNIFFFLFTFREIEMDL